MKKKKTNKKQSMFFICLLKILIVGTASVYKRLYAPLILTQIFTEKELRFVNCYNLKMMNRQRRELADYCSSNHALKKKNKKKKKKKQKKKKNKKKKKKKKKNTCLIKNYFFLLVL